MCLCIYAKKKNESKKVSKEKNRGQNDREKVFVLILRDYVIIHKMRFTKLETKKRSNKKTRS